MRMFMQSLQSADNEIVIPDRSPLVQRIVAGVDTTDTSISWFLPYLASDFPEITGVTKKYIFIWTGSHGLEGAEWGQGDNLDLSDFESVSLIFTSAQSQESPRMYRVNGQIFFYFHPLSTPQETDCYVLTSPTGSLTDMNLSTDWTFHDNVLGLVGNENHTGYLTMREISAGSYEGRSLTQTVPPPSVYKFSSTPDGLNWTRGAVDNSVFVNNPNYSVNLRFDWFFTINGRLYYFAASVKDDDIDDIRLTISRSEEDYRTFTFIQEMQPERHCRRAAYYYEEETKLVHIYVIDNETHLLHATLDVSRF